MAVVIETTIGEITIDLFTDARPRTCMNFLKLCKMKYYNLNLLYSVERNFIAQTGDPSGTGQGGASIYGKILGEKARYYEGEKLPLLKHNELGTVSMVSCGNNLFGSQFFITLAENLDSLDNEHLVFGEVTEGMEVLLRLNQTLTDEKNRPYQDIRITHAVVLEDPYPDPEEIQIPDESPIPKRDILESDYIAADEIVDDTEGKSLEEIQEEIAEKEAKARATILEMVGDLPEADIAPPENVLFVCKLNPVTTSDDLEIIFSRFGKIKSCEVICDRISKNSLQYAFIEFTEQKFCEDAYFKMDNVLIDDRRIHVDFSQSVSKIQWKGKGRGVDYYDDGGKTIDKVRGNHFNPIRDVNNSNRNKSAHDADRRKYNNSHISRDNKYDSKGNDSYGLGNNKGRNFDKKDRAFDRNRNKEEPTSQLQGERKRVSKTGNQNEDLQSSERKRAREKNTDKISSAKENKSHNVKKRSHSESDISNDVPNDKVAQSKMLKHLKKELKKKKRSKKHKKKDTDSSDSVTSEEDSRKKKRKRKKQKTSSTEKDTESEREFKKKKKKKRKKKRKVSESNSSA